MNLNGVPTFAQNSIRKEIFWLTTWSSLSENWLMQILSRWQWSSFNDGSASFPHPLSISSGDSFPAVLHYDLTGLWCCKMLAGTNQTFIFWKDNILLFQSQLTLRANEMGRAKGQLRKDGHKNLSGLHSIHPGIADHWEKKGNSN